MTTLSFDITREQAMTIGKIVNRAKAMHAQILPYAQFDGMSMHMDLSACIANGCPLKLHSLLEADDTNFAHDVFGIQRHIDRTTGKLGDCFRPRFAA